MSKLSIFLFTFALGALAYTQFATRALQSQLDAKSAELIASRSPSEAVVDEGCGVAPCDDEQAGQAEQAEQAETASAVGIAANRIADVDDGDSSDGGTLPPQPEPEPEPTSGSAVSVATNRAPALRPQGRSARRDESNVQKNPEVLREHFTNEIAAAFPPDVEGAVRDGERHELVDLLLEARRLELLNTDGRKASGARRLPGMLEELDSRAREITGLGIDELVRIVGEPSLADQLPNG